MPFTFVAACSVNVESLLTLLALSLLYTTGCSLTKCDVLSFDEILDCVRQTPNSENLSGRKENNVFFKCFQKKTLGNKTYSRIMK